MWNIERQATFYMDCSVDAPKELKKIKHAMRQLHPYPNLYPKAAYINFGMWGRVLDVMNHAKL